MVLISGNEKLCKFSQKSEKERLKVELEAKIKAHAGEIGEITARAIDLSLDMLNLGLDIIRGYPGASKKN